MITTNRMLWFGAVEGAVAYRIYVYDLDGHVRGPQEFEVADIQSVESEEGLEHEIELYDIEALTSTEGKFNFHIYAVDENGLQSLDPFIIEGIEIDFLPPPDVVRGGIR